MLTNLNANLACKLCKMHIQREKTCRKWKKVFRKREKNETHRKDDVKLARRCLRTSLFGLYWSHRLTSGVPAHFTESSHQFSHSHTLSPAHLLSSAGMQQGSAGKLLRSLVLAVLRITGSGPRRRRASHSASHSRPERRRAAPEGCCGRG